MKLTRLKTTSKLSFAPFAALCVAGIATSANAGVVVFYDSNGAANNQLSVISSLTDSAFVTSPSATTSVGSDTEVAGPHGSQSVTVTQGTGNDLHFRFGAGTVSTTVGVSLTEGRWIGFSFVAAQTMELTDVSFNLFNNSANASTYSARDVGAFVGVDGTFTQFGLTDDSPTGNGNQGTKSFTDSYTVSSGQTVEVRLAFTDKTNTASNLQAATRVGSFSVSAVAIPEPTVALLGGLGLLTLLRRRRG